MEIKRVGMRPMGAGRPHRLAHPSAWPGSDRHHWLRAGAPATAMTHIAIQEALDGRAVERLERSAARIMAPK